MTKIAIFLVSVILTGCAAGTPLHWYKPGGSEAELKQDRKECAEEAREAGKGEASAARALSGRSSAGVQVERSNRAFRMCMEARGWSTDE